MTWTGSILLHDESKIENIQLDTLNSQLHSLADGATLRLLSVVETARIPLYLAIGSPYTVSTSNPDTERWFSNILLGSGLQDDHNSTFDWWSTARPNSPLGILVAVESTTVTHQPTRPRVTEILFYSSPGNSSEGRLPTPPHSSPDTNVTLKGAKPDPTLNVHALALSSDLLHHDVDSVPTPPSSPLPTSEDIEAVFLPALFSTEAEVVNEPPVRKRKTANDAFDEAGERWNRARRKCGEGVAAAASTKNDPQMPTLKHSRSASYSQSVSLQSRPPSRSPSIASSRPPTAAAAPSRRSTLSRVQSAAVASGESTIEAQNKDLISRIVMAGMRLYGLVRSKNRKSRANSAAPSPAIDATFEELEVDRKNDEEYKLVYHQVFKGACFAFRASIDRHLLQPFSERVRDVADQLLLIFCQDPLEKPLDSQADRLTPGGRKAFGGVRGQDFRDGFEIGVT